MKEEVEDKVKEVEMEEVEYRQNEGTRKMEVGGEEEEESRNMSRTVVEEDRHEEEVLVEE